MNRSPIRSACRSTLLLLCAGLAGSGLLFAPAAHADPAPASVDAVVAALGDRTAGSYLEDGATVVTVTDDAAAAQVRASGAVPQRVARGGRELAAATTALDSSARIPGTAWAVDPASNQVVVSVDDSVSAVARARLDAVVDRLGSAVRVERIPGTLRPTLAGGDAVYSSGGRCSAGFNVRSGTTYYFLTAGHCGNLASTWSDGSAPIGSVAGSSFPGNDYAIVKYTATTSHPGMVDTYTAALQDITNAGTPSVGQTVSRSGSTTHVRTGSVTALNATVNYAEGTVYGLIRTTVCAEPGDSGGALYRGTTAYGLTSGGSGNCSTGGTTYFQPVTEALSVYGVSVY